MSPVAASPKTSTSQKERTGTGTTTRMLLTCIRRRRSTHWAVGSISITLMFTLGAGRQKSYLHCPTGRHEAAAPSPLSVATSRSYGNGRVAGQGAPLRCPLDGVTRATTGVPRQRGQLHVHARGARLPVTFFLNCPTSSGRSWARHNNKTR